MEQEGQVRREESVGAKMVSGKLTVEMEELREASARSLNPRFERMTANGSGDRDGVCRR